MTKIWNNNIIKKVTKFMEMLKFKKKCTKEPILIIMALRLLNSITFPIICWLILGVTTKCRLTMDSISLNINSMEITNMEITSMEITI